MKKNFLISLSILFALILSSCNINPIPANSGSNEAIEKSIKEGQDDLRINAPGPHKDAETLEANAPTNMVNPMVKYDSFNDLEDNYDNPYLTIPSSLGFLPEKIFLIDGKLVQINYISKNNSNAELSIRSKYNSTEDISGLFGFTPTEQNVGKNNQLVHFLTLKNDNELCAWWTHNNFSFSIYAKNVSKEQFNKTLEYAINNFVPIIDLKHEYGIDIEYKSNYNINYADNDVVLFVNYSTFPVIKCNNSPTSAEKINNKISEIVEKYSSIDEEIKAANEYYKKLSKTKKASYNNKYKGDIDADKYDGLYYELSIGSDNIFVNDKYISFPIEIYSNITPNKKISKKYGITFDLNTGDEVELYNIIPYDNSEPVYTNINKKISRFLANNYKKEINKSYMKHVLDYVTKEELNEWYLSKNDSNDIQLTIVYQPGSICSEKSGIIEIPIVLFEVMQ